MDVVNGILIEEAILKRVYSRVPNKRGVRIIGGLEMVRHNNNRGGWNNRGGGGGVLGKIENSRFLW